MEANLKTLLANVRPEEVAVEEVTLYEGAVVENSAASLSDDVANYEYLEVYVRYQTSGSVFEKPVTVTQEAYLSSLQTSQLDLHMFTDGANTAIVRIDGTTSNSTTMAIGVGLAGSIISGGIYKVVGYKRRYSKTSLAEITEAASKPNLFINTWHASPKVRNQRGFDGNWSALAIGAYGLDMWLKTSATHKGFIVEAGSYKPSTKHTVVADDGAILGTVISPADGGHWLHAFPFASDKFSIREGDIPLGWSPDTDSRLDECSDYYRQTSTYFSLGEVAAYGNRQDITLSPKLRKPVFWQFLSYFGNVEVTPSTFQAIGGDAGNTGSVQDIFSVRNQVTLPSTGDVWITWKVDATIALSEVTDDAEHRVVWG